MKPTPALSLRRSLETSRSSPSPLYDMLFSNPGQSTAKPCASCEGKGASTPLLVAGKAPSGSHSQVELWREPLTPDRTRSATRGRSFKSTKSARSVRLGGETVLGAGAEDGIEDLREEAHNPCLVCSAIRCDGSAVLIIVKHAFCKTDADWLLQSVSMVRSQATDKGTEVVFWPYAVCGSIA